MYQTILDLLLHKQIQFEKGKIYLFQQTILISPLEYNYFLLKTLESKSLENIIYYSTKETGMKWLEDMIPRYNMDMLQLIKWGNEILSLSGWGILELKDINKDSKIALFSLKDATIALKYGKSDHAVDHLLRGYVASFACKVFGCDMDAVEHKCIAKGDETCEYLVKPANEWDLTNQLVKKQLYNPIENNQIK